MTPMKKRLLALLAGGVALFPMLITGCQSNSPQLTKEEEKSFRGGPMPESARQKMQERLREAQQKTRQPIPGPGAARQQ